MSIIINNINLLLFIMTICIGIPGFRGEKFIVNLSIPENKGSGNNIVNLKSYIIQNKLPINPNGSYDIISNEPEISNYFLLQSKTGELKQRNNIDRETLCKHANICQKTLLVSISSKVLEVIINIEDENDNTPQFPMRHKTLSIQENSNIGTLLSLPTAEDLDNEKNSISRYFIKDPRFIDSRKLNEIRATKYFTIIEKLMDRIKIPYLKLIKEIDREENERFELILFAEDSGKQQGSCTITINIVDVNDNSPQWPSAKIHKKVRECDRQGPLLELQAIDRDDSSTINGQIKYKISDHSPKIETINRLFYIAGSSLFLSSQTLQLVDIKEQLVFFVTAVDGGGRENDTTITIEIEDCNDHPPNIQIKKSTVAIRENDKSVLTLTTVTVKDEDKDINSEFICDLNDTTYFLLTKEHTFRQPTGGSLVIFNIKKLADVSFDRESVNFYSVLIRCVDQGRPSLTGEKLFSVTIIDENDNTPKFPSNEMKFSITENNLVGASIGYVRAYDPDDMENGRVSYQIINNEENYLFTITSFGKIETKWKFDREAQNNYTLVIMAKDNGIPSLNDTCTIEIFVLDVNDCYPVFKQHYLYQITESNGLTTIHAMLGKIVAEDMDQGENGTVRYKIRQKSTSSRSNNNGLHLLKLTSEGMLSIYGVVDREKYSSIQAEIIAYDDGKPQLSATTTVIIDILDVNDNKPKFRLPNGNIYNINISTDFPIGKQLANVEADDPDKGENGTISYLIIGQQKKENLPYQLQQDGRLILIQNLKERDDLSRLSDRLIIRAADNGVPPKSGLITIHIKFITNSPASRNHLWNSGTNKKTNDKNRYNNGNVENYRDNDISDNMTMLYILAGVLFVVFIIVLLVLVYTYFSGRLSRNRQLDLTRDKDLNNYCNDGTGNYECDLLTANTNTCQENFNKILMGSISSSTTDKNNYTHLMRMNEAKYTPMDLNTYYTQSMNTDRSKPIMSNVLKLNPDIIRNEEQFLENRAESLDKTMMQGPGNKWNSIENITTSNNSNKIDIKPNDNGFFYNAHSYAAYINQFGVDEKDSTTTMDDNTIFNKNKIKQQTLPNNNKKSTKEDQQMFTYQPISVNTCSSKNQSKKCYVSSSFV